MKRKSYLTICILIAIGIVASIIYGISYKSSMAAKYDDGVAALDSNTIVLPDSHVKVNFSEVLLSEHNEQRKLIISEQNGQVATEFKTNWLSDGFKITEKSQMIYYNGTGYFVVDLGNLTPDRIIDNEEKKILTIRIDHPILEVVDIDPNMVKVGATQKGLLALGNLKLTVNDYIKVEKELKNRLTKKFDTAENGQQADTIALDMVKSIYEPIVKAVDDKYELRVEYVR